MVSKKSYRKFTKSLSGHVKRVLGIQEAVNGVPVTLTPTPPPPQIPEYVATECAVCRMSDAEIHTMVQCKHPVCYPCLMQFLINLVTDRSTGRFECPCCNESLHPNDFYQTVDKMIKDTEFHCLLPEDGLSYISSKFETEYLKSTLNKMLGVIWCPGVDCSYAVISFPGSKCPKAKCPIETCGTEFCTSCKCEWHSGMSCKNHKKLNNELEKTHIVKGQLEDFKMCPKCGVTINRVEDGTCNEVTCTICSTNFCWLCLKPAEKIHFTIYGRCPLYGNRKKAKWTAVVLPIGFSISAPIIFTVSAIFISGYLIFYRPFPTSKKYYFEHLEKRGKFKSACLSILRFFGYIPWMIITSGALITFGVPLSLGYFYYALSKTIIVSISEYVKSKRKPEDDSISIESTEPTQST
ncbi:E3 ubiquitin-protein ligase RNF19B [Thelohanellus kitauei]|uniref:RBR-type E3 ubiquitin transferase n=1 Tax=Thelohanellus kitauei TaxID=669202 RepID=A0A0C2JMK5_THEKT|nr:E3 ubiquitin-protein ligase RNF19B [Thelohanellus kitauei]